jgi:hypothetical protein
MTNTDRLTLRLSPALAEHVRQSGGSEYVRTLITERLENRTLRSELPRSKRSIEDERELLNQEWEEIKLEWEELRHFERLLWRRDHRLDQIRSLLTSRREQLDDEWEELEELRCSLEILDT